VEPVAGLMDTFTAIAMVNGFYDWQWRFVLQKATAVAAEIPGLCVHGLTSFFLPQQSHSDL